MDFLAALLALVPVAVGALLATISGLVARIGQRSDEHKKWLRDQRFEAIVELRVLHENMRSIRNRVGALELRKAAASAERKRVEDQLKSATAAIAEITSVDDLKRAGVLRADLERLVPAASAADDGEKSLAADIAGLRARFEQLKESLARREIAFNVLGPASMSDAMKSLSNHALGSSDEYDAAIEHYVAEARKVLKIK